MEAHALACYTLKIKDLKPHYYNWQMVKSKILKYLKNQNQETKSQIPKRCELRIMNLSKLMFQLTFKILLLTILTLKALFVVRRLTDIGGQNATFVDRITLGDRDNTAGQPEGGGHEHTREQST